MRADLSAWIDRVDGLIVELTDRKKPACGAVFESVARQFAARWHGGELAPRAGTLIPAPDDVPPGARARVEDIDDRVCVPERRLDGDDVRIVGDVAGQQREVVRVWFDRDDPCVGKRRWLARGKANRRGVRGSVISCTQDSYRALPLSA